MSLAVDPGARLEPSLLHLPGRPDRGRRARRQGGRMAPGPGENTRPPRRPATLLTGLPGTSGRHGGCRLLIASNGALLVGTGDAAIGTHPQDLTSLGGKTLRLNRITGAPWPDNPFISSSNASSRYVLTFGHRNVQGLARAPDGSLLVGRARHQPRRRGQPARRRRQLRLEPGARVRREHADDRPPTCPGASRREVELGVPTIATSGAAWVRGKKWGAYENTLAVAALKGERVVFMSFDSAGTFSGMHTPTALRKYGRLRSVTTVAQRQPDGDHVQRRRARRRAPGAARRLSEQLAPTEVPGAQDDRRQPDDERPQRQPRHPRRLRNEPAQCQHEEHQPQQKEEQGHPPRRHIGGAQVEEQHTGHAPHPRESPRRHLRLSHGKTLRDRVWFD